MVTGDRSLDKVRFHGTNEDQFSSRAARPARPRRSRAAPSAAGAGDPRSGPQRPAGGRRGPAVDPGTGRAARGLARDRGRGLRAARRRGLSRDHAGRRHPCRDHVPAAARPPTSGAGHGLRRRLPAGPARSRPLPARDVVALGQAGARHRPEPAARLSRRARDARAARCPGGLPQSRPGHGRRRRFDRRLLRVRAGPQARRSGPARRRRAADRHRGSDPAREPRGPARDRSRGRRDPGRRFRDAGRAARRCPRRGRGA